MLVIVHAGNVNVLTDTVEKMCECNDRNCPSSNGQICGGKSLFLKVYKLLFTTICIKK